MLKDQKIVDSLSLPYGARFHYNANVNVVNQKRHGVLLRLTEFGLEEYLPQTNYDGLTSDMFKLETLIQNGVKMDEIRLDAPSPRTQLQFENDLFNAVKD